MANAGNLLGTTLTSQSLSLGAENGFRMACISGGVIFSLPSQNGQLAVDLGGPTGSGLKSTGRLARSEATITQRPNMGSFLNSDIVFRLSLFNVSPYAIQSICARSSAGTTSFIGKLSGYRAISRSKEQSQG